MSAEPITPESGSSVNVHSALMRRGSNLYREVEVAITKPPLSLTQSSIYVL